MGFSLSQWQGYFSLTRIPSEAAESWHKQRQMLTAYTERSLWTNEADLWPGRAEFKTLDQSVPC